MSLSRSRKIARGIGNGIEKTNLKTKSQQVCFDLLVTSFLQDIEIEISQKVIYKYAYVKNNDDNIF